MTEQVKKAKYIVTSKFAGYAKGAEIELTNPPPTAAEAHVELKGKATGDNPQVKKLKARIKELEAEVEASKTPDTKTEDKTEDKK